MFFDIFSALCEKKGVSRYKACTDIGLNRAAVAKWKNGATPTGTTIFKMADYFGVTTDYLLGTEQKKSPSSQSAEGGIDENDAEYQEARDLIEKIKSGRGKKYAYIIGLGGANELMEVDEDEYQNLKAYLEVRRALKRKKQEK